MGVDLETELKGKGEEGRGVVLLWLRDVVEADFQRRWIGGFGWGRCDGLEVLVVKHRGQNHIVQSKWRRSKKADGMERQGKAPSTRRRGRVQKKNFYLKP